MGHPVGTLCDKRLYEDSGIKNQKVALHIMLYLFYHWYPRMEVVDLNQKVEV